MWRQQLNRPNRNRRHSRRPRPYHPATSKPICDTQTGFIHHAPGFPLEFRRVWFDSRYNSDEQEPGAGEIGLIFESDRYIKPGTVLEVSIPLRNETTRFRGKVVLIRNYGDYFEIGLWMHHAIDASRVRIVEQICHIESYLQERKYRDGPYSLNRDRIATEWIMENAETVPRL